jgi:hypothetical protein
MLIIAGAGPGIGLAAARRFGAEGLTVALIGRREEALTGYQRELEDAAIKAIFRVADCADATQFDAALQEILSAPVRPTPCCTRAAISSGRTCWTTAAALTADFAVNVAVCSDSRSRGTRCAHGTGARCSDWFIVLEIRCLVWVTVDQQGGLRLGHSVARPSRHSDQGSLPVDQWRVSARSLRSPLTSSAAGSSRRQRASDNLI